mmetsp:Transcript_1793/g.4584  ORF Transcript_1793/g.4584 Transcript_1793/m.4584 type:complete len:853 (+) Transcript_1793:91-2649(+)
MAPAPGSSKRESWSLDHISRKCPPMLVAGVSLAAVSGASVASMAAVVLSALASVAGKRIKEVDEPDEGDIAKVQRKFAELEEVARPAACVARAWLERAREARAGTPAAAARCRSLLSVESDSGLTTCNTTSDAGPLEPTAGVCFEVSLERRFDEQWGFSWSVSARAKRRLIVSRVSSRSAVGRWNKAQRHFRLRPVSRGDELISVNGATERDAMRQELKIADKVCLVFMSSGAIARPVVARPRAPLTLPAAQPEATRFEMRVKNSFIEVAAILEDACEEDRGALSDPTPLRGSGGFPDGPVRQKPAADALAEACELAEPAAPVEEPPTLSTPGHAFPPVEALMPPTPCADAPQATAASWAVQEGPPEVATSPQVWAGEAAVEVDVAYAYWPSWEYGGSPAPDNSGGPWAGAAPAAHLQYFAYQQPVLFADGTEQPQPVYHAWQEATGGFAYHAGSATVHAGGVMNSSTQSAQVDVASVDWQADGYADWQATPMDDTLAAVADELLVPVAEVVDCPVEVVVGGSQGLLVVATDDVEVLLSPEIPEPQEPEPSGETSPTKKTRRKRRRRGKSKKTNDDGEANDEEEDEVQSSGDEGDMRKEQSPAESQCEATAEKEEETDEASRIQVCAAKVAPQLWSNAQAVSTLTSECRSGERTTRPGQVATAVVESPWRPALPPLRPAIAPATALAPAAEAEPCTAEAVTSPSSASSDATSTAKPPATTAAAAGMRKEWKPAAETTTAAAIEHNNATASHGSVSVSAQVPNGGHDKAAGSRRVPFAARPAEGTSCSAKGMQDASSSAGAARACDAAAPAQPAERSVKVASAETATKPSAAGPGWRPSLRHLRPASSLEPQS